MTEVAEKEGGTKHFRQKKQKVKFYRRAIRSLKQKHFKTKTAKTRKMRKMKYLANRLKTLTARKRSSARKTPSLRRTRRIATSVLSDNYVSPRIVSIQPTPFAANSPTPSPLRLSQFATSPQSSPATVIEMELPPALVAATASYPSVHSSMATELVSPEMANSMSAHTDRSVSIPTADGSISPIAVAAVPAQSPLELTPTSSFPDSLHLSDLGESPTQSPNSMASAKTTLETM